jgi:hypothetical protein
MHFQLRVGQCRGRKKPLYNSTIREQLLLNTSCSGSSCQIQSNLLSHPLFPSFSNNSVARIQQKSVNMFSATVAARSLALRSRPLRISLSLQHSQPQSTSTSSGTDNYWQQIKPWKDVSAEEFMSYRWQVSSRSLQSPVSLLTSPASKHRTRYKKATLFSLRSIIADFGQI